MGRFPVVLPVCLLLDLIPHHLLLCFLKSKENGIIQLPTSLSMFASHLCPDSRCPLCAMFSTPLCCYLLLILQNSAQCHLLQETVPYQLVWARLSFYPTPLSAQSFCKCAPYLSPIMDCDLFEKKDYFVILRPVYCFIIYEFSSIAQLCPSIATPWTAAHQASL